jgi:Family of unknown function (DUF6515)
MLGDKNIKMKIVVPLLIVVFFMQAGQVQAWGWGESRHHFYPHGTRFNVLPLAVATLIIAGATYYYSEGIYYQRMSDRYVVVAAPVGAVVTTLPQGYQPVIIDGVPYYIINGVTYMYTPYGYQVVPQPNTIVMQNNSPAPAPINVVVPNSPPSPSVTPNNVDDSYTVNIPNSKGGYNLVTLKRSGNGFIGPQGEFYTEFPRIEQLKLMYAK